MLQYLRIIPRIQSTNRTVGEFYHPKPTGQNGTWLSVSHDRIDELSVRSTLRKPADDVCRWPDSKLAASVQSDRVVPRRCRENDYLLEDN